MVEDKFICDKCGAFLIITLYPLNKLTVRMCPNCQTTGLFFNEEDFFEK